MSWSRLVSYVFHPLFMMLAATAMCWWFDSTLRVLFHPDRFRVTLIILVLGTVLFPLLNFYILLHFKLIKSLEMQSRRERVLPFVLTFCYYALVYFLLRKGVLPGAFYAMYTGALLALAAVVISTPFFKISAHAVASAGVLGMLSALFQIHGTGNTGAILFFVLITGVVMAARLHQQAHRPVEVYTGAVLGFLATYATVVNGWWV